MAKSNLKDIRMSAVPVTLDVPRKIRFDMNALAELEDRYGSPQKAFEALQNGSFKAVRFLLWAGLIHEDEKLTERQVGAMLTMQNLGEVIDRIGEAINGDMPEAEEAPKAPEGQALDPT